MQKKLAFLLDNSGSMVSHKQLIQIFLKRADSLLATKNATYYGRNFSGTLQSGVYDSAAKHASSYRADGGSTAIQESLLQFIDSLNPRNGFQSTDKVLAVLFTDGQASSSHYYEEIIKEKITIMENNLRWDWLYIGTDPNAIKFSSCLGIKPGKSLRMSDNYTGFEAALDSLLEIIDGWAENKISGDNFFSDSDREKADSSFDFKATSRLI